MNQKLYIHVGMSKTGTSTIQKFLNTNSEFLKENGVYYPEPLTGPLLKGWHEGHLSIMEADSGIRYDVIPWYVYSAKYYNMIKILGSRINILSAEGLCYENPDNLRVFRDNFDVNIICFFRNFFDYLMSNVKQIIKEGLRQDLFTYLNFRNWHVIAELEKFLMFFGKDNFTFVNYDKIKKQDNIVDVFLSIIECNLNMPYRSIINENVTPSDALTMFMYQLSFFPFAYSEWATLKENFLQLDLQNWHSYRATFLPSWIFDLDDDCKRRIRRQGELLQDPDWYDYTMSRGEELAAIENHDLPPEIQHDIWEKLSDEARSIILRYWPKAGQAKHNEPLLPALEKIAPDVFEQMTVLRHGYTVSIGNRLRLQGQLAASEAARTELDQASQREWQCSAHRRAIAARHCEPDTFFSRLRLCLAPLVSTSARQAYDIRRSGLFDTGWYLERYPDVAEAGIDPVVHYVRFGAKEGRDPAPWFSTSAYLQANPDVAASGVNPFYHYIRHGVAEGRGSHEAHC